MRIRPRWTPEFPQGPYVYQASNGDSTTLSYSADYYPAAAPYLTGTNYSDLKKMDANSAFTFQFSTFAPGSPPAGSSSFIFLTIYDQTTNSYVYEQNFLSASTTSLVLPANTLVNGDTYESQLIYSNYTTQSTLNTAFAGEIGYDVRSDVIFTPTAVPEPATLVLLAPACAVLGYVISRRRRR